MTEPQNTRQTATCKLLNTLISERDWSAQEVCFILLGTSLDNGSGSARCMDCKPSDWSAHYVVDRETGEPREGKSIL